jgi:hypothetical protein
MEYGLGVGILLVDTREQNPFDFSRFAGWFTGIEKKALKIGDYSIGVMEDMCVVERRAFPIWFSHARRIGRFLLAVCGAWRLILIACWWLPAR